MNAPFTTPLSDVSTFTADDGEIVEGINSWGFAEAIVNIATERLPGNVQKSREILKELVEPSHPLLDLENTIGKAKTDDKAIAFLLQACADALEDRLAQAFGQQR